MSVNVRVRFAPSPTGYLHIGGARTALFNWLYARNRGGTFVLRIEDTDRDRSTEEFIETIIDGLNWLGLKADEGPLRQTDRMDIYKGHLERLILEGRAYHCYCTKEELEAKKEAAVARKMDYRYDGACRERLSRGEGPREGVEPVVRFRMPPGTTFVEDLIRGNLRFENDQFDDFIIARSDGTPVYNFVVVVDDLEMGITHIIRGDDHINNTPKQLQLYRALGDGEPPKFAHLPMILGSDKTRLSKRHGATSVTAYRDMGYLPDALNNYLVRLGWSFGDQEVFSMDEMIEKFSFENIGKSAAVFNPEKLIWLNGHYIRSSPSSRIAELLIPFLVAEGLAASGEGIDRVWLERAVDTLKERSNTLVEMAASMRYYMADDIKYDEKARDKFLKAETVPLLRSLHERLGSLDRFDHGSLEECFNKLCEEMDVKLRKLAQPARVALTGGTASPGIYDLIEVMGKERVLARLDAAIAMIQGA